MYDNNGAEKLCLDSSRCSRIERGRDYVSSGAEVFVWVEGKPYEANRSLGDLFTILTGFGIHLTAAIDTCSTHSSFLIIVMLNATIM